MGFMDGLLGNSSSVDVKAVAEDLKDVLFPGENIEQAYKLIRDLIIFTDKRLIFADKQGMTGKKVEYHSIPYKSISHFSTETAGTFDLDAELKIYISSSTTPIEKTFKKGNSIVEIQKLLAYHVCK
ncbi:PH domain-containing protein [Bacillus sp. AGMB 02131]|uniref:PH domain-containing protein n=1 Tax=Peribacillus faecalis TaxID=2772559 RepID=A0A927CUR6_9BACI|nr:PH domain-containing protein [Peribacillus faecalis]MBD3107938.1 PH domain-containing protein [Peribacillus faecalis]